MPVCVCACVGFPVDIVLMSQYSNYQSFCLHLINESTVLIRLQHSLCCFVSVSPQNAGQSF